MATNVFDHGPDHVSLQDSSKREYTSELSAFGPKTGRSQLGADFQPSDLSVICGRGRDSYNHKGNHRFRTIASVFAERYSQADCKTVKATLVFNIVTRIRRMGGHFCKYEKDAWFEVGDRCARGKVSSLLRDKLHTQYRSSAKAKIVRRRAQHQNKTQTQHESEQLVDGTGGLSEDDSSITSSDWGSSLESQEFEESLTGDDFFDIAVF